MFSKSCLASVVVLVGLQSNAYALKPAMHAELTQQACVGAGLPKPFCQRIATEDYNTDAREWDDLRAHAQIDDGETACIAADKTASRVWQLGSDLRAELAALKTAANEDAVGRTAELVGRALHTIQDNCAHHGMPNPQHSWYSLGDFCDGTNTSPDTQDDAVACARRETTAVMAVVANAVRQAGVARALELHSCPPSPEQDHANQQRAVCDDRFLPAPWDACEFLGEAKAWDGIDRQWNNDAVVPVLREEFAAGLAFEPAHTAICGDDASVLAPPVSEPVVDVSNGAPSCTRVHLMCFGSADSDDSPFADDEAPADGGCAVGGHGSRGFGALLIALALVGGRRRR